MDETALQAVLRADAERRQAEASAAAPAPPPDEDAAADAPARLLRIRFLNNWPRRLRPAFYAVRSELAPYGYTLPFPHVAPATWRPRLETVLARTDDAAPPPFGPLVFELNDSTGQVEVFVPQFVGSSAPVFAPAAFPLARPPDGAALSGLLRDYVASMLRPLLPGIPG